MIKIIHPMVLIISPSLWLKHNLSRLWTNRQPYAVAITFWPGNHRSLEHAGLLVSNVRHKKTDVAQTPTGAVPRRLTFLLASRHSSGGP